MGIPAQKPHLDDYVRAALFSTFLTTFVWVITDPRNGVSGWLLEVGSWMGLPGAIATVVMAIPQGFHNTEDVAFVAMPVNWIVYFALGLSLSMRLPTNEKNPPALR